MVKATIDADTIHLSSKLGDGGRADGGHAPCGRARWQSPARLV
jgi:hypothetical protein